MLVLLLNDVDGANGNCVNKVENDGVSTGIVCGLGVIVIMISTLLF